MPVMLSPLVADAALAMALAIHVELLARLRRVDAARPPWWFGYARDGTNLSAILMMWGAFLLLRFPAALAFLAAGLTAVGTYVLDWLIARALKLRHARLILAVPLLAWVAIVALLPAQLDWLLDHLVDAVQPRH
jgi:hypothetical protein